MRSSTCLALGGLAFAVQAAAAQDSCEGLKTFFAQPPQLGEWAELRMNLKGETPAVSKVSFVGKERLAGREVYRMQMVTIMDGQQHVMQMLTPWDMSVMTQDHDSEIVMKMGDQPATKMSFKGEKKPAGLYDLRKECAKIQYLGEETVNVPAGSFRAHHYSGPDGHMWLARGVPGMRMVRMVTSDGDSVVLTAVGTGAKNEITEKPVDLEAVMRDPEAMEKLLERNKGEAKD